MRDAAIVPCERTHASRTFVKALVRSVRDPLAGLVLFTASTMICISAAATMPIHYGDLLWQRWSGEAILRSHHIATSLGRETFTAAGSPWVPQEWLFAVATTMLDNATLAGIFGVAVGSAVAAAIGAAVYRTWERSRANFAVCAAVVLITAIVVPFESLRAEHVAWLFLAISLVLIEIGTPRAMIACLFVGILWANVHGSVVLLPMLCALRALSFAMEDRNVSRRVCGMIAYAFATLACSWINPVGMRLTEFAFAIQRNALLTANIHEWQRPSLGNPIVAFIVVPLTAYGIAGTVARRKWWDVLLVAVFGYLSFCAGRHIALFAIAAAPAAIAAFSAQRRCAVRLPPPDSLWLRRYAISLSALAFAATLLFVFFTPASVRGDDNVAYAPASEVVLALPGTHRVFCQDFTWCSFLLGHPRDRVWWDGRADAYPPEVWRQALEITNDRPRGAAQENLARHDVDVVVAKAEAPVNGALAALHWIRIADLQRYEVWLRPAPSKNDIGLSTKFSRTASSL